jgi:hypothetical protein
VPSLHSAVAPGGGAAAWVGRGMQTPSTLRYSSAEQPAPPPDPPPPVALLFGAGGAAGGAAGGVVGAALGVDASGDGDAVGDAEWTTAAGSPGI